MDIQQKILVRRASLCAYVASTLCAAATLTACGQDGPLYMPNDPEFRQRATLPEIVRRQLPINATTPPPASGAASSTARTAPSAASAASAAGR